MAQQCGVTKNRVKCALPLLGFCTAVIGILHCRYWEFLKSKKAAQTRIGTRNFRHPQKPLNIVDLIDNVAHGGRYACRLPTLRYGAAPPTHKKKKKEKRKERQA